ncbi:uncharacterized protein N7469_004414 [Penicillium citrinum]|uniref:Uncharacterized protein n=1 Tax=Penicillium citrinum TaxID=5077 RepID=A0A9W9P4D1_PENCI|nr:uncharacterized protein N7469_004414 [Penicillium citrinum]KAJ5235246.1 hypothetical protein N7469_004414 [Penicillium citrinum]
MDENILAAAVVLRFYEELDEAQADSALTSSGLRHAAFWVGFRQEFHMAFSQQQSFSVSLDVCDNYLSWNAAPDNILVDRLLIIAAHVLQFCYDDQSQSTHYRYEELVALHRRWVEARPLSFVPVYSAAPNRENGEILPRKWFMDDCHILAEQGVGLINILLTAYDPSVARVGPGQ